MVDAGRVLAGGAGDVVGERVDVDQVGENGRVGGEKREAPAFEGAPNAGENDGVFGAEDRARAKDAPRARVVADELFAASFGAGVFVDRVGGEQSLFVEGELVFVAIKDGGGGDVDEVRVAAAGAEFEDVARGVDALGFKIAASAPRRGAGGGVDDDVGLEVQVEGVAQIDGAVAGVGEPASAEGENVPVEFARAAPDGTADETGSSGEEDFHATRGLPTGPTEYTEEETRK